MHAFLNCIYLKGNFILTFEFLYVAMSGLFALWIVLAVWRYWKMSRRYSQFPQSWLLFYPVYASVSRQIPKTIPLTSYAFKFITSVLEKFRNEEMGLLWFGKPFLFPLNGELIKIFSSEPAALDKLSVYQIFRDAVGTGLVTCNGDTWKMHRKMYNPAFRLGVLKNYLHIMNENARMLVKNISSRTANDPRVNILKHLKICSFRIVFESVVGLKADSPDTLKIMNDFMELINQISEISVYRILHPWFYYKFMMNFMPGGRKYLKMYKELREIAGKIALRMKESVAYNGSIKDHGKELKSFAQILISYHLSDPSFTFEDLKNEINTFISAGYETISLGLMWCLYLLGLHPDVQEQVRIEVKSIPEEHITYGDLNDLHYLKSVIKESLRIFPPLPFYGRKTSKDINCGKYIVPKGTEVVISPYVIHRDPRMYPEPEEFKPERFMTKNSVDRPLTYISFAEGTRNCIGKRFAMMEMMVILSHILPNFYITSLDKREDLNLCWNTTLVPAKPLNILFTPKERKTSN